MQIFCLYSQSVPLETRGAFIPVPIGDIVPKQGAVSHLAPFFLDICEQNSWTEIDPEEVVSTRFYWNPRAVRTWPTQHPARQQVPKWKKKNCLSWWGAGQQSFHSPSLLFVHSWFDKLWCPASGKCVDLPTCRWGTSPPRGTCELAHSPFCCCCCHRHDDAPQWKHEAVMWGHKEQPARGVCFGPLYNNTLWTIKDPREICKLIQNKSSPLERSKTVSRCDSILTGAILLIFILTSRRPYWNTVKSLQWNPNSQHLLTDVPLTRFT